MDRERLIKYILEIFPMMHRKLFKELRDHKVHGQNIRILFTIMQDDGQPMKHYCEKLLISKPNFTKVSNKLIEEGFLKREADSNDRRVIKLFLTDEGKEVIVAKRELMVNVLGEKLESLSDWDIETLTSSFETIESILNKLED